MGGIERRLRALEDRTPKQPGGWPQKNLEGYFAALENARREKEGREPLRPQPYTEEDYREDMRVIASLRTDPGWDTELGHRFLDEWQEANRKSLDERNGA